MLSFFVIHWQVEKIPRNIVFKKSSGFIISKKGQNWAVQWLTCISTIFTIETQTRTLSKGQNVTGLFIYLRLFFSDLNFSEKLIWSRYEKMCILVFRLNTKHCVDKSENWDIIVNFFWGNVNFSKKFKFSAC